MLSLGLGQYGDGVFGYFYGVLSSGLRLAVQLFPGGGMIRDRASGTGDRVARS